jgi:hypothetical protein
VSDRDLAWFARSPRFYLIPLTVTVAALSWAARPGPGAEPPPPVPAPQSQPAAFADDFATGDFAKWDYAQGKAVETAAKDHRAAAPANQAIRFGRRQAGAPFVLEARCRAPDKSSRLSLRFLSAGEGKTWCGWLLTLQRRYDKDQLAGIQCTLQQAVKAGEGPRQLASILLACTPADEKLLAHWRKYADEDHARRWEKLAALRARRIEAAVPLRIEAAAGEVTVRAGGHLVAHVARIGNGDRHPNLPAGRQVAEKRADSEPVHVSDPSGLEFELTNQAELLDVRLAPPPAAEAGPYEPLDLSGLYNRDGVATPAKPTEGDLGDGTALHAEGLPPAGRTAEVRGLPFRMPSYADGELNVVDVGDSRWLEAADDGYRARSYMQMRAGDGNPACVRLELPRRWYRAAYLLCASSTEPDTARAVTVRHGRFGYPIRLVDAQAAVPAWNEPASGPDCQAAFADSPKMLGPKGGAVGKLFVVRVPLDSGDLATLLDREGLYSMDLELTTRVFPAVHYPDPYHFVTVPLGPSSAVKVLAMTLERSPVEMRVACPVGGYAFVEGDKPAYEVELRSRSQAELPLSLRVVQRPYGREAKEQEQILPVRLGAGQTQKVLVDLAPKQPGHCDVTLELRDGRGVIMTKHTSYTVLAADTRQAELDSQFGVWCFWGGHGFGQNSFDPADDRWINYRLRVMNLMHKAGIRFTQISVPNVPANAAAEPKERLQKMVDTFQQTRRDLKIHGSMFRPPGTFHPLWNKARFDEPWPGKTLDESMAAIPAMQRESDCKFAELLAEDRISTRWLQQVPWWWQGKERPAYDERERRNLDALMRVCTIWMEELRKKHPDVKVVLGNDHPMALEAMLNEGFARKGLVDVAGIEISQFMRMPENPTYMTAASFTRVMREALDRNGAKDVPIWTTEAFYPCTHPGNLTEQTQAQYVARTLLTGLASGVEKIIMPFGVYDMSDDYRFSHWGQPGLCRDDDELQPKPSYTAYAVISRLLDRCRYTRHIEVGAPVVYAPVFRHPDGHEVCAIWTLRGTRPARVTVEGDRAVVVDMMGRQTAPAAGRELDVELSAEPVYVVGPAVQKLTLGAPRYEERPEGKTQMVAAMTDAKAWRPGQEPPGRLEAGNFENPRVAGKFEFQWDVKTSDDPATAALKVVMPALGKDAKDRPVARYAVLELAEPLVLAGKPKWIGAYVQGCGNWGRLIYCLTDAEGEEWISIGQPGDFNVNDPFNWSFLNHVGWRFVQHDLPGHFGGPGKYHWPTQSIWGHFKPGPPDEKGKPTDLGNGVVDWPLTFRKLIVEMRETIPYLEGWTEVPDNTIFVRQLQVGGEGP